MWSNTSTSNNHHALGYRSACEKWSGAFSPSPAPKILPVRLCTHMCLCYWPAGNISQLLIPPDAENEGYGVIKMKGSALFSTFALAFSIFFFLFPCPIPCRQSLSQALLFAQNTCTRLREALSAAWASSPARRDGPALKHPRTGADGKRELTVMGKGENLG